MLVASASMREYFRETMTAAMRRRGTRLSESAQVYLVNLCAELSRAENLFAGTEHGERPALVDLLARAQDAEPHEALRIYKHMGDSSLYLTGFFRESVEEAGGVEYYVSMGGGAYANVAGLMRPTAATTSALFAELSDRFRELVELLIAMSMQGDRTEGLDDVRVLALVERFERTGDPHALEALKATGIILRPGVDDDDHGVN
ncbi:MAG: hypothetical protein A2138_24515 [Deltaproteobacteria bacterium RBG_16_71_12]|nr:MAG: hypothetical protein A2138_24515 [Deltaproteobacteria bacterium RBG_16_71_12]